ncbi:TPA: hypothetical protein ACGXMZ_005342 [Bacillus albus]
MPINLRKQITPKRKNELFYYKLAQIFVLGVVVFSQLDGDVVLSHLRNHFWTRTISFDVV